MHQNRLLRQLFLIVIIVGLALLIDLKDQINIVNPFNNALLFERDVSTRLGLDLQGGLQVLLEADVPEGQSVSRKDLDDARLILENRTNALGVSENLLQTAGDRRIVGEFPGKKDTRSIIDTLKSTALLEFVDTGGASLQPGTIIATDYKLENQTGEQTSSEGMTVYHTVITGADLRFVSVEQNQLNQAEVAFELTGEGARIFGDHTTANVGKYLTIVLDKVVISSPVINGPITGGSGSISGNFTTETANELAIQLRSGSLPVPLKIVETRIIGPTLGEDSLNKSLVAGLIGMIIVILFMAIYYRLPGLIADISIIIYAVIAFAIFRFFHFTLTLPGIAGFLLSTGAALDANILIFERMKEELRNGRTLDRAIEQGWKRAWSSIRDSNIATILTSLILFWFGSQFGATIVKGFSITLALGVATSLFTAIFITRVLLAIILQALKPKNYALWFGI
ncbi:MAG: protein translocase subunit SecD [Anaerolineales bacterium]|nr:protein translocase subunit SecD [Anaerolineales bacterium]